MRLLTRILTFLFVLGVLGGVFTPASAESFKGVSTLVLSSEEIDAGYAVAFLLGAAVASGVFVVVLLIKKKAEQSAYNRQRSSNLNCAASYILVFCG